MCWHSFSPSVVVTHALIRACAIDLLAYSVEMLTAAAAVVLLTLQRENSSCVGIIMLFALARKRSEVRVTGNSGYVSGERQTVFSRKVYNRKPPFQFSPGSEKAFGTK